MIIIVFLTQVASVGSRSLCPFNAVGLGPDLSEDEEVEFVFAVGDLSLRFGFLNHNNQSDCQRHPPL